MVLRMTRRYLFPHAGKELNEIVLYDKTVEKACKGINIIEAEDSRLKDIEFVSKMVNLSDMYIRKGVSMQATTRI